MYTCMGLLRTYTLVHSKFESVSVSEIQWKFTEYRTTDKIQYYIDWKSVTFHWISKALTDSNS